MTGALPHEVVGAPDTTAGLASAVMRMPRSAALALALVLTTGLAACGDDDDAGDAPEDVADDDSSSDDSSRRRLGRQLRRQLGRGRRRQRPRRRVRRRGLQEFVEAFAEAGIAAGGAFTGEGNIGDVAEFFEEAADDAPDEIADALRVFADAYAEFAEVVEESGIDFEDPTTFQDPDVAAAFSEASESFSSEEFLEASEQLEEFTSNNCETG